MLSMVLHTERTDEVTVKGLAPRLSYSYTVKAEGKPVEMCRQRGTKQLNLSPTECPLFRGSVIMVSLLC